MLELSVKSIELLNKAVIWANECAACAESSSKKLFEFLVEDEERHFDQYDTKLANIEKFGERYLALQSIERSRATFAGVVTN